LEHSLPNIQQVKSLFYRAAKPTMTTKTGLLAAAFVAVAAGGCVYNWRLLSPFYFYTVADVLEAMSEYMTFWLPIPFAACAAGRKRLSWQLVGAFAVCEAAAAGWVNYYFSIPQSPLFG
jgi:hypothetical protein